MWSGKIKTKKVAEEGASFGVSTRFVFLNKSG